MRKVVAALNMTLDGICDHTVGIPDEEIHQHYTQLLSEGGPILYGRTTYQLMEFWRTIMENPSEVKSMNDFAKSIDSIPKIVFSNTLENVDWETARLATKKLEEEVIYLKQQRGKDILVGSRSLIIQLIELNLIDEFQLCIYPMIVGKGLQFFDQIKVTTTFRLLKTKIFESGAITIYYQPIKP